MNRQFATEQEFIQKLTQITEANLRNEQFGVSGLAREMGMSRSSLYIKVNTITKKSVSRFISEVRLKRGMELLKQTPLSVSEIAYEVGFGSPTYFIKCFHEFYGFPPGEANKKDFTENESAKQTIQDQKQAPVSFTKRDKITTALTAIVIIILATTSFIRVKPLLFPKEAAEKSIAMLPFIDDSPEAGYSYIVEGLMEEILYKLSLIKDLRVVSRTTSEKYRNSKKSSKEIGKELKTNYILEGSAQTINNTIRIRLQLIETNTDRHLWSKPYEREVPINNIFKVQSELALLVANELNAVITRKEKQQIEKKPTSNLTAYNLYLRGLDYKRLFELSPLIQSGQEQLKAKQLFQQAIQLDPTFADAYAQLGDFYIRNVAYWGNIYLREQYLDSGLMMVNKALSLDDYNWVALALKGRYYLIKGMPEKANWLFRKLPINEASISEYYEFAFSHFLGTEDYYNAIKSFLGYEEAVTDKMSVRPALLVQFGWVLTYVGYPEVARSYASQMLHLYNDSMQYFSIMNEIETMSGNFEAAMDYCMRIYAKDSTHTDNLYYLMINSVWLRDYPNAYKYMLKYGGKYINSQSAMTLGFVYAKNDMQKEANEHYQKAVKIVQDEIKLNNYFAQNYFSHSHLACVYSAMGEKEKALDYLRQVRDHKKTFSNLLVISMKKWPLLDNVRQKPGFAEILADMETNYQQEHKRAGDLLREKGLIE
ncbi:MAG: helix-turn-helix domain-containing protein [Mangrovibacterium sp.]